MTRQNFNLQGGGRSRPVRQHAHGTRCVRRRRRGMGPIPAFGLQGPGIRKGLRGAARETPEGFVKEREMALEILLFTSLVVAQGDVSKPLGPEDLPRGEEVKVDTAR